MALIQVEQPHKSFNEKLFEKLDDILDKFNVHCTTYNNRRAACCPVHGGDKSEAFVIYTTPSRNDQIGNWKCFTNQCEQEYGNNLLGLVQGLLSRKKEVSKKEAYQWCEQFLGVVNTPIKDEIKVPYSDIRSISNIFNTYEYNPKIICSREHVRARLQIPSEHYIKRGFSPEILDKYDIGYCLNKDQLMYNRIVFPVYHNGGMIGCVGRNVNNKCDKCGTYHYNKCPTNKNEEFWASKWINSKNFNTYYYFYNYWMAKQFIEKYGVCVLVEGQGDILRLEESGIHIGLGLFGDDLTQYQKLLLEQLPIHTVILAQDNDKAGNNSRSKTKKLLSEMYNIHEIILPEAFKDIGDLNIEQVKNVFMPILEKVCNYTNEQ